MAIEERKARSCMQSGDGCEKLNPTSRGGG